LKPTTNPSNISDDVTKKVRDFLDNNTACFGHAGHPHGIPLNTTGRNLNYNKNHKPIGNTLI
jgi:hypothetical protein